MLWILFLAIFFPLISSVSSLSVSMWSYYKDSREWYFRCTFYGAWFRGNRLLRLMVTESMIGYKMKERDELQNFWNYSFLVIIELISHIFCYLLSLPLKEAFGPRHGWSKPITSAASKSQVLELKVQGLPGLMSEFKVNRGNLVRAKWEVNKRLWSSHIQYFYDSAKEILPSMIKTLHLTPSNHKFQGEFRQNKLLLWVYGGIHNVIKEALILKFKNLKSLFPSQIHSY